MRKKVRLSRTLCRLQILGHGQSLANRTTLVDAACVLTIKHQPIQPDLELKTRPKQRLGYLLLDIALPRLIT